MNDRVSYPEVNQPISNENDHPSPLSAWKNAFSATVDCVKRTVNYTNIKAVGRKYVDFTTKYGTILGVSVVAFSFLKKSDKPLTLLNALWILCFGACLSKIGPLILPTAVLFAITGPIGGTPPVQIDNEVPARRTKGIATNGYINGKPVTVIYRTPAF